MFRRIVEFLVFQGEPIQQDIPGGIILSNLSLVIQHISHSLSGSYRCKAYNTEGFAVSNTLPLTIQCKYRRVIYVYSIDHITDEPVCKEGQVERRPAQRSGTN